MIGLFNRKLTQQSIILKLDSVLDFVSLARQNKILPLRTGHYLNLLYYLT